MLNKKAIAATAAGVETDGDFKNTVLLLHGDGTNGAQNNTFTDSSTNNFTITRNGNTTQGTFSPFSPTGWSNYFDGTGDYLSLAASSDWAFGTGDFTIEFWINCANHNSQLLSLVGGTSAGYWQISLFSGDMYFQSARNSTDVMQRSATSILDNKWHHVAITRSGTTVRMFFDGALQGSTATDSTNYNISSSQLNIGYSSSYFTGYLSNVRILKGTAQYTSAFTPETSALTAITNTKLLTCQSNRFKDNSTNALAITVNGNPSVQAFSPFAPSDAYDAATHGGSGYFDGSGDYLSLASDSAWALGTGDFTVSCWVYFNDHSRQQIVGNLTTSSNTTWALYIQDGGLAFSNWSFSPVITYDANAFAMKQWNWIEVSRVSGTYYLFINGVEIDNGTASPAQDYSSTTGIIIGDDVNWSLAGPLNGYLCDLRIVKGSGITSSTVPTSPISAITNTQLLCKFQNAGIIDSTAKNVLETVGNAQIDTGTKKFGTGSLEFDGTADKLEMRHSPLQQFGTGDFAIEFWFYMSTFSGTTYVLLDKFDNNDGWQFYTYSDNKLHFYLNNADLLVSTTNLSATTWYHVAVTRSGTTARLFLNGTQEASTTNSTDISPTTNLRIGESVGGVGDFNGFIDDVRITKGVARYTANFTAPTKAFPDQ